MNNNYKIPEGQRVYAIGDIHGYLDKLVALHALIEADIEANPIENVQIVYIGDYVDRGPDSKGVLDFLCRRELVAPKVKHIFLLGNHEIGMREFIVNPQSERKDWLMWGGVETLMSYGITARFKQSVRQAIPELSEKLKEAMPMTHREFLRNLVKIHIVGDYVFAHAGIRPNVSLDKQETKDLTFIRKGFLDDETMHEKRVVHGHSITDSMDVEIYPNRIAIDTGVYKDDGKLSCVVIEGVEVRKLQA